jgi:CheY-like chemotaxis protein
VRLPVGKSSPQPPHAPAAVPQPGSKPLRILLAEDNPANRKLAIYILEQHGHSVESAADGQQAVDLSRQRRYDAIFMDIQMPGMDGIEATKIIRMDEAGERRIPIIAMTAHAMNEDRNYCLEAGMDAYLSKPINAQEMVRLAETLAHGKIPHFSGSQQQKTQ